MKNKSPIVTFTTNLNNLVQEIRNEQNISPFFKNELIESLLDEGVYDINSIAGTKIDYDQDLNARVLLKNYVLYRRFSRLAEFKEVYAGDYAQLQARYYSSDL